MTWIQKLRGQPVVSSIFQQVGGEGTQNGRMHRFLVKLTNDNASINDLYHRQQLSREAIIAVLEDRLRRRLC